ncbi:hypothetical protein [Paraburkholderia sp.]|uniref:hypothetical protein n=1 Tax=Paraburkholderia sp. TaxID=1926495 RepID=UPI003C7A7689
MSNACTDDQQPQQRLVYDPVQLKDESGWFVRVTSPYAFERHINGFVSEAEGRAWIDRNGHE